MPRNLSSKPLSTESPVRIAGSRANAGVRSDERRWKQVLARDASADGRFVYAVRSTGIYCRPSCPSRRPSRPNVEFFPGPAHAQVAGYRPCLRCSPDAQHPQAAIAALCCRFLADHLDQHPDSTPTLAQLACVTGMSPFAVQRLFRSILGVTPREYHATLRAARLRQCLAANHSTVTEAIYDAGFNSSSRVYESAAESLGMTPTRYRNRGAGVTIRYTIAPSPLGLLLVAATHIGLCSVGFGGTSAELESAIREDFANATLNRDDTSLGAEVSAILNQISENPVSHSLAFDVRATAFQRRVWQALREIPRGQTRTYAELARAIGQPTAVRAVAGACASNPLAVVVPCHRVIGSDGKLTGYRWGIERKQALLHRESLSPSQPGGTDMDQRVNIAATAL